MLTVKQIDAAKPKDKPYRISDGNGLYLYIPASGKKVWQLRYQFEVKRKTLQPIRSRTCSASGIFIMPNAWCDDYADEMCAMFNDRVLPPIRHMKMEEAEMMVLLKVYAFLKTDNSVDTSVIKGHPIYVVQMSAQLFKFLTL